mgnify:CR=1 FL=1
MPHYIYDCKACGQPYEVFHSMQVPALVECPFCGRPELKRRILGGSGLIFKGSGFYETDYKRKPAADQKRTWVRGLFHRLSGPIMAASSGRGVEKTAKSNTVKIYLCPYY